MLEGLRNSIGERTFVGRFSFELLRKLYSEQKKEIFSHVQNERFFFKYIYRSFLALNFYFRSRKERGLCLPLSGALSSTNQSATCAVRGRGLPYIRTITRSIRARPGLHIIMYASTSNVKRDFISWRIFFSFFFCSAISQKFLTIFLRFLYRFSKSITEIIFVNFNRVTTDKKCLINETCYLKR